MNYQINASIIVLTYNNLKECTIPCVDSICKNTDLTKNELIIVDNMSEDGTRLWLENLEKNSSNISVVLNDENYGYAKGNNIGIKKARGKYVILLNNDTLVPKGWLNCLLGAFKNENIGLVGPITNRIGSMQQVSIPGVTSLNFELRTKPYTRIHRSEIFSVNKLCFFCVAMPRELIERVGFLDEKFGRGNFEDDDFCLRVLKAGYKILIAEGVYVYHQGSFSFTKIDKVEYEALVKKNLEYFETKHSVSYSYNNLLSDYNSIKASAKSVETYVYRKPIFDLVNTLVPHIAAASQFKRKVKEFDRLYLFGVIRRLYSKLPIFREIPIKIKSYFRFYQTYGIEGYLYRLKQCLHLDNYRPVCIPDSLPKDIPIFVLSFNRLFCLKKLVNFLIAHNFKENIVILDNCSTYAPLINYLNELDVTVIRLKKNYGHLALWKCGLFNDVILSKPFVLTDCDIIPDSNCPADFLIHFYRELKNNDHLTKVGFSLSIDDIPDQYSRKEEVLNWELKHWEPLKYKSSGFFQVPIDTTFALYRPGVKPYMKQWWYSSRSNYPYFARHFPWYITENTSEELIEEESYYVKSLSSLSSHWYSKNFVIK